MSDAAGGSRDPKLLKLFMYADTFGLTRDERLELAQMILRRDITTWKTLEPAQIDRMLDAFEGATLLFHLLQQRAVVHA